MSTPPLLPGELSRLGPSELLVNELFHSIQGESTHAGSPCFFIRLTGCHLRCVWCDSEYSFFEGSIKTVAECVEETRKAGTRLVEITGGEPLLQPAVHELMTRLADLGHEVLLETSGAVPIDRVDPRVRRIVDWKCPASGMEPRNKPQVISALKPGDELKLIVAHRADYEWARAWVLENYRRIPASVPIHLAPAFGLLPFSDLAAWILEDRLPVRLNLQIHKWIWDPQRRGV